MSSTLQTDPFILTGNDLFIAGTDMTAVTALLSSVLCRDTDEWYPFSRSFLRYCRLKLIPFEVIIETLNRNSPFNAVVQILGNIIMTLPFGFLLPMIIRFKKKYTYIITAFLMPVCIEATQLVLGLSLGTLYRTADIDDVILNSTGIFIGYAVYKLFFYLKEKRMQKQNDK